MNIIKADIFCWKSHAIVEDSSESESELDAGAATPKAIKAEVHVRQRCCSLIIIFICFESSQE
jgi:hypothetical protein